MSKDIIEAANRYTKASFSNRNGYAEMWCYPDEKGKPVFEAKWVARTIEGCAEPASGGLVLFGPWNKAGFLRMMPGWVSAALPLDQFETEKFA